MTRFNRKLTAEEIKQLLDLWDNPDFVGEYLGDFQERLEDALADMGVSFNYDLAVVRRIDDPIPSGFPLYDEIHSLLRRYLNQEKK